LVADAAASRLEETPADPPVPSATSTDIDGRVDPAGALSARVRITLRGDEELVLRTIFRATPEPQWKDLIETIVGQAGLEASLSELKIGDPQATTAPFTVAFNMDVPGFAKWGGARFEIDLPLHGNAAFMDVPDADATGLVTLPAVGQNSYTLKLDVPAEVKVRMPVPVSVSRDYGDYRATYAAAGTTLTAERRLVTRQSELPASRREDYIAFMNVLKGDARQRLSIDSGALAASSAAAAPGAQVKDLNQAGYDALTNRDYARAVTLLARVVELEPKDRTAWNNLGRAHMGLREFPAAIAAYKKQIEVNPYDAYAYNNLGFAYVATGQYVEAEAAYTKQIELNPLDKFANTNLGRLYVTQKQYDKAVTVLEKAGSLTPDDASVQVQLGKAYLSLRRTDEATAAFGRAVALEPTPGTWNDVAYELALGGVDLARAQQYAESALAATSAASRNVEVDNADARALALPGTMASYWDTLGWIYFAKGDLARAEKYVAAAWQLGQHGEVGDHLGQILEKTGRRAAAAGLYAAALSAYRPPVDVREHLVRVAGGTAKADALTSTHRGDLSSARTIPLAGKGPASKKADFVVLFAAPGRVEAVKFVEGDEEMRALAAALQKLPANGMFPDETPAKILRRGIAACGPDGACSFALLLPEDAKPVK